MEQGSATFRERNHGIDLLRIISMLMIIMHHIITHGGVIDCYSQESASYYIFTLLEAFSLCAVNCYALISGYVGANSCFRPSRLALLWLRVFIYSVLLTGICMIVEGKFEISAFVFSFFPITTNRYWFFTSYFLMSLFSPMLNAALNQITKKQLKGLLSVILALSTVVIPVISRGGDGFHLEAGYSALWLMILYLVGGYIKKYGLFLRAKPTHLMFLYIVVNSINAFLYIVSTILFKKQGWAGIWFQYSTVTVFCSAVLLFLFFERCKVKENRLWNLITPLVFGAYLIHDNESVRRILMINRFTWVQNYNVAISVLLVSLCTVAIFVVCIIIDYIRAYLFRIVKVNDVILRIDAKIHR